MQGDTVRSPRSRDLRSHIFLVTSPTHIDDRSATVNEMAAVIAPELITQGVPAS
ncbi:hypothetical protein EV148_101334 [Dokdonella fugitiva]|jgi:hypothetical protein|uniref:Uncharacterized protein n=1 Tax=Dokdonella fugitiva TaxID=328517 RepID=A0A4R2IF09_9GAMM|nr:hypothetical protein EV148_101334 [Dokdonella fugitiva]